MAWRPLGMRATWFAEIEAFPCAVLAPHYPNTPNLGEMTKLAAQVLAGKSGIRGHWNPLINDSDALRLAVVIGRMERLGVAIHIVASFDSDTGPYTYVDAEKFGDLSIYHHATRLGRLAAQSSRLPLKSGDGHDPSSRPPTHGLEHLESDRTGAKDK
jgi:hypothetical protein